LFRKNVSFDEKSFSKKHPDLFEKFSSIVEGKKGLSLRSSSSALKLGAMFL
jgi:hypothetical protein